MVDSERLREIIKSSKMSTKAFSEHIGLSAPQSLYDILNGRNGISRDMARRIHAKCLNYNLGWIKTGEGEKYVKESLGTDDQEMNDREEPYSSGRISIPQTDFSSLVETLNRQQKTIENQAKTIENLTQKKNGNNGNSDIAGSA